MRHRLSEMETPYLMVRVNDLLCCIRYEEKPEHYYEFNRHCDDLSEPFLGHYLVVILTVSYVFIRSWLLQNNCLPARANKTILSVSGFLAWIIRVTTYHQRKPLWIVYWWKDLDRNNVLFCRFSKYDFEGFYKSDWAIPNFRNWSEIKPMSWRCGKNKKNRRRNYFVLR